MITEQQLPGVRGSSVVDRDGAPLGRAVQVYLDDVTGRPTWLTVDGGAGDRERFVPADGATVDGDRITVTVARAAVGSAPGVEADGHLTPAEEAALTRHYGLAGGTDVGTDAAPDAVADATGTTTDATSDAVTTTRSEERLLVGTERVPTGRARLETHVVTEEHTITVPVRREVGRLERATGVDADGEATGWEPVPGEDDVVLREERPVVTTESVPVERVRLVSDQVAGEATVTEPVRRERVEVLGADRAQHADPNEQTGHAGHAEHAEHAEQQTDRTEHDTEERT